MIRANLRTRLTGADIDLAVELLARGSPAGRRYFVDLVRDAGPDGLLDRPELAVLVRREPAARTVSAPLFFYVLVRHALRDAGIDDPRLADYLGALLLDFGRGTRAHRIAEHDDADHRYLVDIVQDLQTADRRRAFLLLVHLGNYSLWISGIFPDYIAARSVRNGGPGVQYYDEMGTRGFRLAAEHVLARELDLADVYAQAAEDYRRIREALNRLSAEFFGKAA
jgi:hypothetical protein